MIHTGKVFIIQGAACVGQSKICAPGRCSFTHSGHQALVLWTAGYLCLPCFGQSLPNSQCHALVLSPHMPAWFTSPPYALCHDVFCLAWLLTKRFIIFCLGTLSPAQFSHHCIKTNFLNVNWGKNNRKGKATKREWEMSTGRFEEYLKWKEYAVL